MKAIKCKILKYDITQLKKHFGVNESEADEIGITLLDIYVDRFYHIVWKNRNERMLQWE
jgi:hypothetical protein